MEERTKKTSARGIVSEANSHAHVEVLHENHVDILYRIEYADGIEFMNYVAYTQVKIKMRKLDE